MRYYYIIIVETFLLSLSQLCGMDKNVFIPPQAMIVLHSFKQNPIQDVVCKPTLWESSITELAKGSACALGGVFTTWAFQRFFLSGQAQADDMLKQKQAKRIEVETEIAKNNQLLVEKFKQLEARYLLCKYNNGQCAGEARDFITVGGSLAYEIVKKHAE